MRHYPEAAQERAMKVQEVILRAIGKRITWWQAAEILPVEAWIVAEISSFQLEWVAGFRPRVAVITNITADHLNRHGTVENYVAAKARLLESQTRAEWTVLNRADPVTAALIPSARGRRLCFGGTDDGSEGAWAEWRDGRRWLVGRLAGDVIPLLPADVLRIPGEHTIENALAACCVGLAAGVAPAAMAGALAAFTGVADRLESVAIVNGVEFVNNTMCTTVDAAIRSIEAYERPVVLMAGGKNKQLDFDPLGRTIAARVKALVAIGTDGPRIAEAARAHGFQRISEAGSMREAVRQAATLAVPGDVVLLAPACASFDWYTSFEARGRDFKAAVHALCGGAAAGGN